MASVSTMEIQSTFNKRLQRSKYNWVYAKINGSDIGWVLTKALTEEELAEEPGYQFRVAGTTETYQVVTLEGASTGLYENLDDAKRVAEKMFMILRKRPKRHAPDSAFIENVPPP